MAEVEATSLPSQRGNEAGPSRLWNRRRGTQKAFHPTVPSALDRQTRSATSGDAEEGWEANRRSWKARLPRPYHCASNIPSLIVGATVPHRYKITVQPLDEAGEATEASPMTFTVSNHDELLDIVSKTRAKGVVPDDEATEFAIGLKLFSEVMTRHRKTELFEPLWPHFGEFMKRLKGR